MLVVCLVGPWPAWAQSLADVAKKEEERRKATAAPAKVYTNKDLNGKSDSRSTASGRRQAGGRFEKRRQRQRRERRRQGQGVQQTDASKDKDGSKEPAVKDQAYWAGR